MASQLGFLIKIIDFLKESLIFIDFNKRSGQMASQLGFLIKIIDFLKESLIWLAGWLGGWLSSQTVVAKCVTVPKNQKKAAPLT